MKKIYHLATCDTCKEILKNLNDGAGCVLQDIKTENISPEQLDWLKEKAGSYEALFSKRALKYREWGLNKKQLSEEEMRDLILKEYTFLKRPVIIACEEIFVGNAPKTIEAAKNTLFPK